MRLWNWIKAKIEKARQEELSRREEQARWEKELRSDPEKALRYISGCVDYAIRELESCGWKIPDYGHLLCLLEEASTLCTRNSFSQLLELIDDIVFHMELSRSRIGDRLDDYYAIDTLDSMIFSFHHAQILCICHM